jgi:hypothetical protein
METYRGRDKKVFYARDNLFLYHGISDLDFLFICLSPDDGTSVSEARESD